MDRLKDMQEYITKLALGTGALLVGYTEIRRVEPVIVLGFPYSDRWFLKSPFTMTKDLKRVHKISSELNTSISKVLKGNGYSAYEKSILSVYGDFRPLAVSAGIGDWGRNGLVVNKDYGSNLLFSAIFTNAPLEPNHYDSIADEHCSGCGSCTSSCPADAFENGRFHTYRCYSYVIRGCSECIRSCSRNDKH